MITCEICWLKILDKKNIIVFHFVKGNPIKLSNIMPRLSSHPKWTKNPFSETEYWMGKRKLYFTLFYSPHLQNNVKSLLHIIFDSFMQQPIKLDWCSKNQYKAVRHSTVNTPVPMRTVKLSTVWLC